MSKSQDKEIETFGEMLIRTRRYHGYSQTQIANEGELSTSQISALETGDHTRLSITPVVKCLRALIKLHAITTKDEINEWLRSYFTDKAKDIVSVEKLVPQGRELLKLLEDVQVQAKRQQGTGKSEYTTFQGISFIGRDQDIEEIYAKLHEGTRFLTLTGLPGVGKTELARQIVQLAQSQEYFSHVLPILFLDAVLPPFDPLHIVREHLKGMDMQQRILLVLDSSEQIADIDNARGVLYQYLDENRELTILATSRVRFSLSEYEVCPLNTPITEKENDETLETLLKNDAVKLFVEGARRNQSDYCLNPQNASTIADLCRGLGGLPLALLIAGSWATRINIQDLYAILLSRDIQELPSDFPNRKRHSTLDSLIEVSYKLLTDQEQTLFRRLGVLAEKCTWKAAAAICIFDTFPSSEQALLSILHGLNRHFLVTFEKDYIDLAHITLRDYASRQLSQSSAEEYMKTIKQFVFYYQKSQKTRFEGIVKGDMGVLEDYLAESANYDWAGKKCYVLKRIYIVYKKLQMGKKEREIFWLIIDALFIKNKTNKYVIIYDNDPLTGINNVNPQYPKDTFGFQNLTEEEEEYYDNLLEKYIDLWNPLYLDQNDEEFMQWLSE